MGSLETFSRSRQPIRPELPVHFRQLCLILLCIEIRKFLIGCNGHNMKKISVYCIFQTISYSSNSAQLEHGGGSPLAQETRDAGGALSNEEYFSRGVSLCREIFTVGWRCWITLVVWFGLAVRVERQLYSFVFFFFFCISILLFLKLSFENGVLSEASEGRLPF